MKRWIVVFILVVAIVVILIYHPRYMMIRVMGGPDVEYDVLDNRVKMGTVSTESELKLKRSGEVVSVAIDGKIIASKEVSKKVTFELPEVQMPVVSYTYSSSMVWINVEDENPYPISWNLSGETPPATFEIPSPVVLMGFLKSKEVFEKKLKFSRISKLKITYDGSTLSIDPKLDGFFKPELYEVNGIESTTLEFRTSSIPKKLEINPIYGKVMFGGTNLEIPRVPKAVIGKDEVKLPGTFLLNGEKV